MLTLREIREQVNRRIGASLTTRIIRFVATSGPRLWGERQPRDYLEANTLYTLYKDLFGIGYDSLEDKLSLGFRLSKRALMHNVPLIRAILARWGASHTPLGQRADWRYSTRNVDLPRRFTVRISVRKSACTVYSRTLMRAIGRHVVDRFKRFPTSAQERLGQKKQKMVFQTEPAR